MSTLMASRTPSGRSRRCNAACYNAKGPDCDCICMGANHGVGERQAQTNTREMGVLWLAKACRSPFRQKRKKFTVPPEQGELFALLVNATETRA
jgi:hypothetical protein